MKIRVDYSPMFKHEKEHGVFCKCGRCLFADEKDLTPPATLFVCPVCHHTIVYHTPSLAGLDKLGMEDIRPMTPIFPV